MLTRAEDVEAHALRKRGWTVSAIARHLGRDRKTVRGYLDGKRKPGERRPAGPDAAARPPARRRHPAAATCTGRTAAGSAAPAWTAPAPTSGSSPERRAWAGGRRARA